MTTQAAASGPGIEFTETMRGFLSTQVKDDYREGYERGKAENSTFEFTLTVTIDDVQRMVDEPEHTARLSGTVTAAAVSATPLTVTEGRFQLLVRDPVTPHTRKMIYRTWLAGAEGRTFYMQGFKSIHDDRGPDLWSDTTTLYVDLYEGAGDADPLLGKGMVHIHPKDFPYQLRSMRPINSPSKLEGVKALATFGRFFAGSLYDVYGGVLSRASEFDPDAPPRERRPLNAPEPEVHFLTTDDGVQLRLTRYAAGDKGPVLLAHGLGVSSFIFSLDTIETNLVEFLCSHGFDVWLLDNRTSIELPASRQPSTGDDIARHDYAAAVARVRQLTGAKDLQMVAHCYGSTTFLMAMLAGLEGVRSAVCSQATLHLRPPRVSRFKAGLYLPNVMSALGVDSLTAYVDRHSDWKSRLFDLALRLQPIESEERCTSPVCRRITFLYSNLYEHDQLNTATHDNLHELFGVANLATFDHLSRMIRKGHVVSAAGEDAYLPYLERLAIPIAFLHGEENHCFLPVGSEETFELLSEKNGHALYRREVVPDYGHIDCIFGKNAATEVYPFMLHHLEATLA